MKNYSIGQFSDLTGLTIFTLRYYEDEGLLKPERDQANRRIFNEKDFIWIEFILRLKAVGMPLKEIKAYADLREQGNSTYQARMKLLEKHLEVLDKNIDDLIINREKLNEKISFYKNALKKEQESHNHDHPSNGWFEQGL